MTPAFAAVIGILDRNDMRAKFGLLESAVGDAPGKHCALYSASLAALLLHGGGAYSILVG